VAGIVWGVMPADLLLLHGFTQTGASWDGVRRALGGRYRPLAPDLGAGPWEAELDRLETLAPASCVLAGYSMGGRLALALALRRPERVERLVLVSASPGLADEDARAARRAADAALADRIEAVGAEAFAREWAAQPLFAGQAPAVVALAHEDRLRRSAAEHAAQLRGLGTGVMPPLWERLGELALPVTLVVGERDAKFRGIAERMARRLPRGEIVVVEGAGHAVALEAPAAVAEAIDRTHPAVP
jgi:2-succinyl-6-hydroxy-2,4-cyclohexadiene-1-carboxylate synthase